jgi:CRP/FNR family transcriptional regulator, cyclic AMP receptor protein
MTDSQPSHRPDRATGTSAWPAVERADQRAILRGKGFLARLSPELGTELIGNAPIVHYPAGSIHAAWHDLAWAALVYSGLFREYLPTPEGRQVTIRYVGAGDLVGYPSSGSASLRAELEAVEAAELLHLDLPRMERLARGEPQLSTALTAELSTLLRRAYRTLVGVAFAPVRSRVARDLLDRAARVEAPRRGTRVRVTQQGIADATGSVREVVARALRELRLQGVIETDQSGITILKVESLIAEAGIGG